MRAAYAMLIAMCVTGCNGAPQGGNSNASNLSAANAPPTEADRLSSVEQRLTKVESDTLMLDLNKHDEVYLRPADAGYSLLDTDFGRLAVSIENVQPYANGSQVSIQVGNPTMARFTSMKAKIEWGTLGPDNLPADDHEHPLDWAPTDPLTAGNWHTFVINLADVPPTKLGWVRISNFNVGSVFLIRG